MTVQYKIHPLCQKFPQMTDEEFRGMVQHMETHGQTDPIWVYGKVLLDGKHRLEACRMLGSEPNVRQWKPKHGPEEPQIKAFVLGKNFHRRHLTPSQRAIIAADLVTTDGRGRPESNSSKEIITQADAAAAGGISVSEVKRGAAVLESGSAALQDAVRDGHVAVGDAVKVLDLPKPKQTAAVRAVKSGKSRTVAAAAEREPGEDPTEPEHLPKRKFDDKLIDDDFGKLIRLVD